VGEAKPDLGIQVLVVAVAQFSGRARTSSRLVEAAVVAEGQKTGMEAEAAVSLAMTGTILKETAVPAARKLAKALVVKLKVISTKVLTAQTPSAAEVGVDFMAAARARRRTRVAVVVPATSAV